MSLAKGLLILFRKNLALDFIFSIDFFISLSFPLWSLLFPSFYLLQVLFVLLVPLRINLNWGFSYFLSRPVMAYLLWTSLFPFIQLVSCQFIAILSSFVSLITHLLIKEYFKTTPKHHIILSVNRTYIIKTKYFFKKNIILFKK